MASSCHHRLAHAASTPNVILSGSEESSRSNDDPPATCICPITCSQKMGDFTHARVVASDYAPPTFGTRRRLETQGFVGLSDAELAEAERWLRLTPALCTVFIALGTALAVVDEDEATNG